VKYGFEAITGEFLQEHLCTRLWCHDQSLRGSRTFASGLEELVILSMA
jgi:hypothetical protein